MGLPNLETFAELILKRLAVAQASIKYATMECGASQGSRYYAIQNIADGLVGKNYASKYREHFADVDGALYDAKFEQQKRFLMNPRQALVEGFRSRGTDTKGKKVEIYDSNGNSQSIKMKEWANKKIEKLDKSVRDRSTLFRVGAFFVMAIAIKSLFVAAVALIGAGALSLLNPREILSGTKNAKKDTSWEVRETHSEADLLDDIKNKRNMTDMKKMTEIKNKSGSKKI